MEKLLLKPTEAADALGVSRSTLYELVADGTVPSIRLGRSVRVPAAPLREFVERKTCPASGDGFFSRDGNAKTAA